LGQLPPHFTPLLPSKCCPNKNLFWTGVIEGVDWFISSDAIIIYKKSESFRRLLKELIIKKAINCTWMKIEKLKKIKDDV
jgi:hypothetical protein